MQLGSLISYAQFVWQIDDCRSNFAARSFVTTVSWAMFTSGCFLPIKSLTSDLWIQEPEYNCAVFSSLSEKVEIQSNWSNDLRVFTTIGCFVFPFDQRVGVGHAKSPFGDTTLVTAVTKQPNVCVPLIGECTHQKNCLFLAGIESLLKSVALVVRKEDNFWPTETRNSQLNHFLHTIPSSGPRIRNFSKKFDYQLVIFSNCNATIGPAYNKACLLEITTISGGIVEEHYERKSK